MAEYFGTEDSGPRTSRCYELASSAMIRLAPRGATLVHGSIYNPDFPVPGRMGHAWIELPDGAVWEPVFGIIYEPLAWLEYASPEIERAFTYDDVLHLTLSSGHHGPWTRQEWEHMVHLRDK